MQQYTNTLDAELRYASDLGLEAHANFGAGNCYPGTPLESEWAKQHPEWLRGHAPRYEVAEVRAYVLGQYRETLEIGASGLSIDFCRYPETIDSKETCTGFLRELRALAREFEQGRGRRVPILIRFPGTGVRLAENFDYAAWAREDLVDYLAPSNIQGRHMNIDMAPYIEAVRGSKCALLPCVDALSWGLPLPGPFLWRAGQLYDAGVAGLYIYQADARVLGRPLERRVMRLLASSGAVREWRAEDARLQPVRSKGVYITPPHEFGVYHGWERLRVWLDGVAYGPVEYYLDGQLVHRNEGPPYELGGEDYESDGVIPAGKHELKIRAQDGAGWLEQTFAIEGG